MNQLLQVFSRSEFGQAVKETKAERHARGFKSWDQFVAILFCQLADAQSLREITGGLASCEGRLEQLGTKVPNGPRWRTPTNTDHGNCSGIFFIRPPNAAERSWGTRRSFDSRIAC